MNGCFSAIKRDEQRGERSCCKVCTTGWHREGARRAPNLLFPAPALLVCSLSLALGCFEAGENWEVFGYWKV